MDRESLREILDNMDSRVYAFIGTNANLDEIRDMILHRDERRMQAMESYVDASFTGEDEITEAEETNEVKEPEETKRAGRGGSE